MHRRSLLLLLLAGCASTSTGTGSAPSTTSISMESGNSWGGTSPATATFSTSAETGGAPVKVSGTLERVWEALPQVYQELGIEVGTLDGPNHVIGNRELTVMRRLGGQPLSAYLSCGNTGIGNPIADHYRVRLAVLTTARAVEGGTELRTTVSATASSVSASGAPVTCGTTGRLEQAIARGVQTRLAQ